MKSLKLLCLILALIFLAVGCEKKPTKPLELSKPIAPHESIQSLHEAVEMGNFNLVKDLISDGPDVNTRSPLGSMPLHLAVRKGHIKVAELLILNGADVNTKNWQGQPVLHVAVDKGNRELVELLLENGADINATDAVAITQPFGCMRHGRDQEESDIATGYGLDGWDRTGSTALHRAAVYGNLDIVKLLISRGARVNAIGSYGARPLHYANTKDVAELLLANGAKIDAENEKGETALDYAANDALTEVATLLAAKGARIESLPVAVFVRNLEKIKKFIDQGESINSRDRWGKTPLHYATTREIAKLLIANGAKVDAKNEENQTALHEVAARGDKEVAELLIANGADVNALDMLPCTPLYEAVENEHREIVELLLDNGADVNVHDQYVDPLVSAVSKSNKSIVKLLIDNGADVNAERDGEATALHLAVERGNREIVQLLIDKGACLDAVDKEFLDVTPLHTAVSSDQNNINIVALLIEKGADINPKDIDGATPLFYADTDDMAALLINKGADVNAKTNDGQTPMHSAASFGSADLLELLISKGANINAGDEDGITPLDVAALSRNRIAAELLSDKGAKQTSLNTAIFLGDRHRISDLLNRGAHLDIEGTYTPLHYAVETNNKQALELLIANGCDVNIRDDLGKTPLHLAIDSNREEIAKWLISKGADVNISQTHNGWGSWLFGPVPFDTAGWTPLHIAAWRGRNRLVKVLIDAGAGVNAKDSLGRTPLHFATWAWRRNITKLLVESGADTNTSDNKGFTPLHYVWALNIFKPFGRPGYLNLNDLFSVVDLLIAGSVDLNARGGHGWAAIHFAAKEGHNKAVQMLVTKGADVNLTTKQELLTALHFAIANKELVELLITHGANVNVKTKESLTPLHIAAERCGEDIVGLLMTNGADINARDEEGRTPFYYAATTGVAELFIAKGVDINTNIAENRETPLHSLQILGSPRVVRLLIEQGADVDARDEFGHTPLHTAAIVDLVETVKMLIANGADVNAGDNKDSTPLHIACSRPDFDIEPELYTETIEVVQLLLANNAGVNTRDSYGRTPLSYVHKDHTELVDLLRKYGAKK